MALTDKLTAIANAIRTKTGKTGQLTLDAMPDEIMSIEGGGGSSDVLFPFGGVNATLVSTYDQYYTLDDTSFERGVTAPSTSTTIKAAVTNAYTNTTGSPTYAYGDKDIVVVQYCNVELDYDDSAVEKVKQIKSSYAMVSWLSKRKTTDTSNKTTRQLFGTGSANAMEYYNGSGVLTRAVATYGVYATPQAPSVASSTAASTYVRVNSPSISCRYSTTYESADNMKKITDFRVHWHVEVYAVDPFTSPSGAINAMQDEFLTD